MLLALLVLACAEVPHAALHPVGADLYAEVPDVGAAIAAYANAPAVKLVSSEGAANIAALAKDVGFDLQAMVGSLLPVADPNRPNDRWWPWSAAHKASFSISGLERAPMTGATTPVEMSGWMVCDFAASDAAEQAEKALIAMGGAEAKPVGDLTVGASTTKVLEIGSPFESIASKAWLARLDTRLVLGVGAARSEDYSARSAAAEGGLVGAWNANGADKLLGAASGVTVLEILSDMDDLPAFAADSASLSYAAMFLAPFLSAKGRWRIELQGERFVTNGIYEPRGKSAEVLGVFGQSKVPANAIQFLPPDAVGTWITDVDVARAENAIGALLRDANDSPVAPAADGEPRMADGLKPTMAMSLLPFQSLMSPTPRILLTLELSDAAKFQAGLDAWIVRVQAAHPELAVERKPYKKVPTITLSSSKEEAQGAPGGGGASPFGAASLEPTRATIAVLPDRVIFASAPSVAREEIKRLQDKSDVAPHAATQKVARPADAFEVSTMDWGSFLSKIYDGARGLAPMLGQNLEKPIDLEKLPTAAQLFAPFQPSTSWARRVDGRILVHSESSFGPETPIALAATGFIAMRASRLPGAAKAGGAGKPDGPAKPDGAEPAADAKPAEPAADESRTTTLAALREVRTAIAVYRSQFNRVPSTAADLLQKTDAFPDGFLKGGKVPTDGWGRELVYAARAEGASYTLHSTGADGIDQQGAGDDVRLP